MKNLEEIIQKHRDLFDSEEPESGHFERFERKLALTDQHAGKRGQSIFWLRIAAVILVFITTGLVVLEMITGTVSSGFHKQQAALNLPDDVREAMNYYEQQSLVRLQEINQMATKCPEGSTLLALAEKELKPLNDNYKELSQALLKNPENKKIHNALIKNSQYKESLLNDIILQGNIQQCK